MAAVKAHDAHIDDEESRVTPRSFHSGLAPSLTLPRTPTQACFAQPERADEMVLFDAASPPNVR